MKINAQPPHPSTIIPQDSMPLPAPFKIERYFAEYEFSAPYLLSASDCESVSLRELLSQADADGLRRWETLSLGYTESPGHPVLREAIAQLYANVTAADTLVLSPIEGIFVTMHALLRPGDHVVAMFPAYQALYEVARSVGCDVSLWELTLRDGRWQADLDRLRALITPRTRMLIVNVPHNPTGYLPDRATFEALVSLAREHNLVLFCDEMYRWLEFDPATRLPSAVEVYERAIVLSGLSKTFGLPGLRMGWLVTHDAEALAGCQSFKDYTSICHSAPSEALAIIALRAREALVTRNLQIVQHNAALAAEFFAARPALFRWIAPQAGSVAFPQWLGAHSVEAFAEAAVKDAGIMIVPGAIFDRPGQHFRVGLGRRNFGEVLGQLEEFLNR
jgi:aspartate/methionine/tyrosine aminotransferase